MKFLHVFRVSAIVFLHMCVAAIVGLGCKDSADTRVRLDTTGWETIRVELSGELLPLAGDGSQPKGLREPMVNLWGERMNRAKEGGLFVVNSAKDVTAGAAPSKEGEPFTVLVEGKVAPPCNEGTAWPYADRLWEVMAHHGDFGFYRISAEATATAATLLRNHPDVLDVSTRAELRGFTVVKVKGGPATADALLEFLGPKLLDGMAVHIPEAAVPGDLKLAPGSLVLAIVETNPTLDEKAVAGAELLPARDGVDRVNVRFKTEAVPAFSTLTDTELGRHFVVLHDRGEFLTAPIVGSRVRDGQLEIRMTSARTTGLPTVERIAAVLGSGGLTSVPYLHKIRVMCVKAGVAERWLQRLLK